MAPLVPRRHRAKQPYNCDMRGRRRDGGGARGRRAGTAALLALALALAFPAAAAASGQFPAPTGFVNDFAGVLPPAERARLEAELAALERETGAEMAVAVVPGTAPETPKMYAVKLFEVWGIGKRGRDNGVLVLVAMAERRVEVEVGYGLEGVLPDGLVGSILDREVVPRFRAGDLAGGIAAGVAALAAEVRAAGGAAPRGAGAGAAPQEAGGGGANPSRAGRGSRAPALLVAALAVAAVLLLAEAAVLSRRRRRCPRCGSRLRVVEEVLREATPDEPGQARRVVSCLRCDYAEEVLYALPWVVGGWEAGTRPRRRWGGWGGWGGGWGGGGGGFGGFGGGRSGGGGAGRSW